MICSIESILRSSQCVYNWLGYLSKASDNSKLIAESSIKFPFVECLERHSIKDIYLEYRHPLFKGKRIDVCVGSNAESEIDFDTIQNVFIEFKFVRGDTLSDKEKQRYFNDIMRLSCLKKKCPQSTCYLLICGETISFNDAFRYCPGFKDISSMLVDKKGKKRKNKKSIYNKWLSFNMQFREKSTDFSKIQYNKYIKSFKDEYLCKKRDGVAVEDKEILILNTHLKLMLPSKGSIDNSYSLGLWEIS